MEGLNPRDDEDRVRIERCLQESREWAMRLVFEAHEDQESLHVGVARMGAWVRVDTATVGASANRWVVSLARRKSRSGRWRTVTHVAGLQATRFRGVRLYKSGL